PWIGLPPIGRPITAIRYWSSKPSSMSPSSAGRFIRPADGANWARPTVGAAVGGGRTKGLATLHAHGQGNPLDGRTLQGSARLSRALRVLSAVVDVNDPFFSHPLRCSARAKGHRQVCPRLEPSPTPGPWYPA